MIRKTTGHFVVRKDGKVALGALDVKSFSLSVSLESCFPPLYPLSCRRKPAVADARELCFSAGDKG